MTFREIEDWLDWHENHTGGAGMTAETLSRLRLALASEPDDEWPAVRAFDLGDILDSHDALVAACRAALEMTKNVSNLRYMDVTATLRAALAAAGESPTKGTGA